MNNQLTTQPTHKYKEAAHAEILVLGAIMLDSRAMSLVSFLVPEAFVVIKHKKVFKAMLDLREKGTPIDIATTLDQLILNGDAAIGDVAPDANKVSPLDLTELTSRIGSSANVEYHARIVYSAFISNKALDASFKIVEKAQDPTIGPDELVGDITSLAMQLHESVGHAKGEMNTSDAIFDLVGRIEAGLSLVDYSPIFSGTDLDQVMEGWVESAITVLGGLPGMGKTALALHLLLQSIKNGVPCSFYSYEMPRNQILSRLISNLSGVPYTNIVRGETTKAERVSIAQMASRLQNMPITVKSGNGLDVYALRADVLKDVHQNKTRIVFIDYLDLIPDSRVGMNTHDAIGIKMKTLKALAKEAKITIVLLCQLEKSTEKQPLARPIQSNLRGSSHIIDAADRIMFIWRPSKIH